MGIGKSKLKPGSLEDILKSNKGLFDIKIKN